MSDTPETDKAERMAFSSEYMVPTEFARQLERERNEARELVEQMHAAFEGRSADAWRWYSTEASDIRDAAMEFLYLEAEK